MARRKRDDPVFSMFPFLSITVGLIGTLTLMICVLALAQTDPKEVQEVQAKLEEKAARRAELEQIKAAAVTHRGEIDKLQPLIEKAEKVRQQLAQARAELKRLEETRNKAMQGSDQSAKALAESGRLQTRINELQAELARLLEEIKRLTDLLKERQKPVEANVKVLPGGTGYDLKPTFVECAAAEIVLHPQGGSAPVRIRWGDVTTSQPFIDFLEKVAEDPKGTVIFLVRSDGIGTYYAARHVATVQRVRNGKLSIVGQGKLDLSVFERKREQP